MSQTDQPDTQQHRDIFDLKWSAGECVLVEKVPADWTGPWPGGTYRAVSPPHSDAVCPFKDATTIRWERTTEPLPRKGGRR